MVTSATGYGAAQQTSALLAFKRNLKRLRLPKFSVIHSYLHVRAYMTYIYGLWQELFDDPPPTHYHYVLDLESAFFWRVQERLFPVGLDVLDMLFNSGAEWLVWHPIPFDGLAVPWEVLEIEDLAPPFRPVVATLSTVLEPRDLAWETTEWQGAVAEWWKDRDRTTPEWNLSEGKQGIWRLQESLRCLQPPFDGLADVVDTIVKGTGNLFLDLPEAYWHGEYMYDDAYYWCPEDVRRIADEYAKVKPAAMRIQTYTEWYGQEKENGAQEKVIALLGDLIGGAWTIQDGELVFYEQHSWCSA